MLMNALDLERPDLNEVADAWRAGRTGIAIEALLHHFEARRLDPHLLWEPAASAEDHRRWSDAALEGSFELQDASGRPPRRGDGGLDWHCTGPGGDPEWPRFLNRHDFFRSLLRTWRITGGDRYRRGINDLLVDWLDHAPPPRGRSLNPAWRSLEAARRSTLPWLEVFFTREPGPALDPESSTTGGYSDSGTLDSAITCSRRWLHWPCSAPRGQSCARPATGGTTG